MNFKNMYVKSTFLNCRSILKSCSDLYDLPIDMPHMNNAATPNSYH